MQDFLGGNSVKATSGINGTPTSTQAIKKIPDNAHVFYEDTAISAAGGKKALVNGKLPDMPTTFPLVKVLTNQSGPAVEWLMDSFNLDLSLVSQLGGHSFPRTHRGKERFPGMTITYALMEKWSVEERSELCCCCHCITKQLADARSVLVCVFLGTISLALIQLALALCRTPRSTS